MAQESLLQKRIRKELIKRGYIVNKVIVCSTNGWPDLEAGKDGRIIFLEVKSKGKPLEPLQQYVHDQLKKHGFRVYKIDRWEDFEALDL